MLGEEKTGIVIFGYGRMGHTLEKVISETDGVRVSRIIDVDGEVNLGFPDMVLEFSTIAGHDEALDYALEKKIPLISGTTNLSDVQIEEMKEAASEIPILYSTNFSYGVYAMRKLVSLAAQLFDQDDWDIEVIESHHRKKKDAPSGTAKTLIDEMGGEDRISGVHSLRSGNEAGSHTVTFFGDNEHITIEHSTQSRRIFAKGALRAAKALKSRQPGFYTLDDIL